MNRVRLEILSWLAETTCEQVANGGVILEQDFGENDTVKDVICQLSARYPRFGSLVFDVRAQRLTEAVCILINGHHLELANGLDTKLSDGDVLTFVPPMEGG